MTSVSTDDTAGRGTSACRRGSTAVGHPLVARLSRAGQRLRQCGPDHRWVLDTAVVVWSSWCSACRTCCHDGATRATLAVAFTHLPVAGMLALQAGLVLPLLWRRRARRGVRRHRGRVRRSSGRWTSCCAPTSPCSSPCTAWPCTGGCDNCRGPARSWPARWCWSPCGCPPWCPSGTRCSSCSAPRPRPSRSAWRYGSAAPSWPRCANAPPGWRSSATSAAGWPPPPNAPGSPARCTTSSATTSPSSSRLADGGAYAADVAPERGRGGAAAHRRHRPPGPGRTAAPARRAARADADDARAQPAARHRRPRRAVRPRPRRRPAGRLPHRRRPGRPGPRACS